MRSERQTHKVIAPTVLFLVSEQILFAALRANASGAGGVLHVLANTTLLNHMSPSGHSCRSQCDRSLAAAGIASHVVLVADACTHKATRCQQHQLFNTCGNCYSHSHKLAPGQPGIKLGFSLN